MVKNQRSILDTVQKESPFTKITQNITPIEQPQKLMAGGARNIMSGGKLIIDDTLKELVEALVEPSVIAKTNTNEVIDEILKLPAGEEIEGYLKKFGLTEDQIKDLIEELDEDSNGIITFGEYENYTKNKYLLDTYTLVFLKQFVTLILFLLLDIPVYKRIFK